MAFDYYTKRSTKAKFVNILSGANIGGAGGGIFLYSVYGYNPTAVQLFFQIFNNNTLPADGAAADIGILVPSKSEFCYLPTLQLQPIVCNVGMSFCMSTTSFVKTIVLAGSEFRVDLEYGLSP